MCCAVQRHLASCGHCGDRFRAVTSIDFSTAPQHQTSWYHDCTRLGCGVSSVLCSNSWMERRQVLVRIQEENR
ncbi:hypothetical protein TNCT_641111 [Trichonephila clavata]|uniref:Uncharacterized protein n=1 Tax=Trichonephila clavata TaxID=2740835 RepID=A0A8X6JE01_TRICU|nr:hypothetical protein TNCT_641111 [Trichonephila clavata]